MEKSTFEKRLDALIQEKSITRKALAQDALISEQAIGNYINGKRKPDFEVIAKIAKVLNVSSDYLIGISDIKSRNETIQNIHRKTGLWESAISKLITEECVGGRNISSFVSYLVENEKITELINVIEQRNEFSDNTVCRVDIGGKDYETNMNAIFKLIINDLLWEIIDGYKVKPGQSMIEHKEGGYNG